MNRRGHMSHKIPNVKLRPVPATSASTSTSSRSRLRVNERDPLNAMDEELIRRLGEDAEDEEDSTRALRGSTEKPWKGVVITFTGVDNKPYLTGLAKELGATVESALTVQVTHVVASGFGSPKYLYAVEHRLPVMAPSWISFAHERWLNGEELDVERDIEEFRLQPFLGLKIALSGIEPIERRRALVQYITQSGGIHSKDLDRECTHLVSSKPTFELRPSEKVKWAVREIAEDKASRRAGKKGVDDAEVIKIVYEQWIWDCVGFAGRWKEDHYDAGKARRAGRVNVDDVLSGRIFEKEEKKVDEVEEEEVAEPAVVNKRKRLAMDSLVSHLISTTAVTAEPDLKPEEPLPEEPISEIETVVPPAAAVEAPELPARLERVKPEPERKPSMLHLSRNTSFAAPLPTAGPSRPSSLHPDPSFPSTALPPPPSSSSKAPAPSPMFYSGLRFSHAIQEECDGLETALTSHGGELVSERDRLEGVEADYVIIRLCAPTIPVIPEGSNARVVTECWVEGCCFEQRLMSPSEHLVFQPVTAKMPVPGAEKLSIHLSGFATEQTVYLKRLIRLIGATLSHSFNRKTTHLVCHNPSGLKYNKSFEWKIPALRDTWLLDIGGTGQLPSIEEYRLPGPSGVERDLRRLTTTASTGNTSAVSDLNEPIDFGRIGTGHEIVVVPATKSSGQHPSPRAPKPSQHSVASSRKLGLTPTHVDDISSIVDSGRKRSMDILSPPKATGTERLLNHASVPGVQVESIDARISRTSSAPAGQESLKADKEGRSLKAATASGIGGDGAESLGRKGMTDILKRLAEEGQGDTTPANRSKVQRRPRQISKVKSIQANPYSPMNTSVSPSSRFSSPPPPQHHLESPQNADVAEESMQVNFVDPTSIRETKWLRDALKRGGDGGGGRAGDGGLAKRSRR